MAEGRGQKSEVRSQRSEVGGHGFAARKAGKARKTIGDLGIRELENW